MAGWKLTNTGMRQLGWTSGGCTLPESQPGPCVSYELTIVFVLGVPLSSPSCVSFPHRLKPPPTCRCQTSSSSFASNHNRIFLHPFFLPGIRDPVNGAKKKTEREKKDCDHACHAGDLVYFLRFCTSAPSANVLYVATPTPPEAASNCNHNRNRATYVFPSHAADVPLWQFPVAPATCNSGKYLGINDFPSRLPRPR
jgi:hypothetical protein